MAGTKRLEGMKSFGRADPVTSSRITGWYVAAGGDGTCPLALIDGSPAGQAHKLSLVNGARGGAPDDATGFLFPIPRRFQDAHPHTLELELEDGGSILFFSADEGIGTKQLRFRFAAPDADEGPAALPQANTASNDGALRHAPEIQGAVQGFEGLYLVGWAIRGRGDESAQVEVRDSSSSHILAAVRACRQRDDIAKAMNGAGNYGFRIPLSGLVANTSSVSVYADGVELQGSPLAIGATLYDGAATVSQGVIEGWATARTDHFEPPIVEVRTHDGRHIARFESHLVEESDPNLQVANFRHRIDAQWYGRPEVGLLFLANGTEFARTVAKLEVHGYLDSLTMNECSGWLLCPCAPLLDLEIQVFMDGLMVGSGLANRPREDLRERHPESWRSGFHIEFETSSDLQSDGRVFSLRLKGSDLELFDGPYLVAARADLIAASQSASNFAQVGFSGGSELRDLVVRMALDKFIESSRFGEPLVRLKTRRRQANSRRVLTIVVPVYRNVAVTRDCIESVLRHRRPDDLLLIVDDQSPDQGMSALLWRLEREPGVYVVRNEKNLGFVQSVNRALGFCVDGDVLLLNSDTRVFAGAFDELQQVANGPGIGTVTALSNNATIFSYPHPKLVSATLDDVSWEELAAVFLKSNCGLAIDVPTGHGFCLLIKRELLDLLGHFDKKFGRGYGEENDYCLRAASLGFRNVAAAGVLVEHRESVSFGADKNALRRANLSQLAAMYPEFTPMVMKYERLDGLRSARWAADLFRLSRCRHKGRFALVIDNWLMGGTKKAIEDLETSVAFGGAQKLRLEITASGRMVVNCHEPRVQAVFAEDEVDELFDALDAAGIALVHIHQLLGYTVEFLRKLCDWLNQRHSVYFVHDYYFACPRVTLLDAGNRFCSLASEAACSRCLALGGAHEASRLGSLEPPEHRAIFGSLMRTVTHIVAPSEEAASYVTQAYPDLHVSIVPHPQRGVVLPRSTRRGSSENIVLIGALGPHKGSEALLEMAKRARIHYPHLRFTVVGFTDIDKDLATVGNVSVTGQFEPSRLGKLLESVDGRIALFLHRWPETFSYTLTEAVAAGFFPVVPDIGAPAERVRAAGFGYVYEFPCTIDRMLEIVEEVRDGTLQGDRGPRGFKLRSGWNELARSVLLPTTELNDRGIAAVLGKRRRAQPVAGH